MCERKLKNQKGFSLIELMIVVIVLGVLSVISLMYLSNSQRLYKADDQALAIVDMLQEARQRSLTQREIIRVEIDMDDNVVRLIDENLPNDASDDQQLRSITLAPENEVTIDDQPNNIILNPPEPLPAPVAVFQPSVYTPSVPHRVCTIRYASNGSVLDAGSDEDGNGAIPTGVTIHIWMPDEGNVQNAKIARAITIIGSTGTVRLWEYDFSSSEANKWIDSRRSGSYGG